RTVESPADGRSGAPGWRRVCSSAIWGILLAGLIGLTVWQGLHSEALAEARAAYEGRPGASDLGATATTWWRQLWRDPRSAARSRRRRTAEAGSLRPDYRRAPPRAPDPPDPPPADREAPRLAAR